MNTNRDLSYQLYLHKVEGFERTSYSKEHERYADVREGRTEQIKKNMAEVRKDFLKGKGVLSKDSLRNIRYHIIVAVAMVSRNCIDGGMPHDAAYTLADIYIQRADVCNSEEKLIDLLEEMQLDYASRMRTIKKDMAISIHIRRAIDYIYDNLDKKLTVNELSEFVGLNVTYFSKLFMKETGMSAKDFVHDVKINTAKNMLTLSDYDYSEIALALGFSSQSAFITLFKEKAGSTPKKYRDMYAKHE